MESVPIKFCNTVGFNLVNNTTKEAILDDLKARFGVIPLSRRTDVISEKNMVRLGEAPSVLQVQSTGTSYVLFLTRIGYQQVTLLIDRKVNSGFVYPKMIAIHLLFPNELFDGTVFTGELIKGFHEWIFLIDDLLAINGKRIGSHMFRERYSIACNAIKDKQRRCMSDMFSLCMKRFFQVNRVDEMLQVARYMPYKIKGVSIRSTGPHRRDLFIPMKVEQAPARQLLLGSNSSDDTFTVSEDSRLVHIPSIEASHYLKSRFEGVPYGKRVAVTCEWNAKFERWQPVPSWL